MKEPIWIEGPALVNSDVSASELRRLVGQHQALVVRRDSDYYAFLSSELRIKPWYVKFGRNALGRLKDYLDFSLELPGKVYCQQIKKPDLVHASIQIDADGSVLRVAFPYSNRTRQLAPAGTMKGIPAFSVDAGAATADSATIERYPLLHTSVDLAPAVDFALTIDLSVKPPENVENPEQLQITGLPRDWEKLAVGVEVASAHIDFKSSRGEIELHRDESSVPCVLQGTVRPDCKAGQTISIATLFYVNGSFGGFIRRNFVLGQGPPAPVQEGFPLEIHDQPPTLTVLIFQNDPDHPGELDWTLLVSTDAEIPKLPAELHGAISLGQDPESFVNGLYQRFAEMTPGKHMQVFRGFGELLWRQAPEFFRTAYWAIREVLGDAFPIQFISTDPHIAWELMRPVPENDVETELLAMTHPVARCLGKSQGYLRRSIPDGPIRSIAPNYPSPNDRLEYAQREQTMLQQQFQARTVEGTREAVWECLLGKDIDALSVLHFAGHGAFPLKTASLSSIKLQDANLNVLEVDTQEVKLGKKTRCLVVFNACETGATGSVLGGVGGWAQTLLQRRFGGFIAPLWSIDDADAAIVGRQLFEDIVRRKLPVARALLAVRQKFGPKSPTYLAYLFYGDVMARIATK